MSSVQDTAYPRFKSNVTPKELTAIYTPTPEELTLAQQATKGRVAKLGFLILLKSFQRLGYAVAAAKVPLTIIEHIGKIADTSASAKELESYDGSGTRRRHIVTIRDYLRLQPYDEAAQQVMVAAMESAASTKHDLVDLINIALEELVRQSFELPGFSTMERMARSVRTRITSTLYQQVATCLNREERFQIQALFVGDSTSMFTPWNQLKQEPGRPMLSHLQELVERLQWLFKLQVGQAAISEIPQVKVRHFAAEAQTLNATQMRELEADKRYTLAVALLRVQYARTLDDIAEMYIKRMGQLHYRAKEALADYRIETQQKTDELITTLRDVVMAYRGEGDIQQRWEVIESLIGNDHSEQIIKSCEAHLAYVGNNYLPFLKDSFRSHRATLFRFLDVVPLRSSTQDVSLLKAIQFIQKHRATRSLWVDTIELENTGTSEERELSRLDLSWIPGKWWPLIAEQRQSQPYPSQIHRRNFEMCVFSQILLELQSGDLFIEGSYEFGDYYSQLISWEEYETLVEEYGTQVNLPTQGKPFVAKLKLWLESLAQGTDKAFPENADVDYQKNKLVVRKPKRKTPKGFAELKSLMVERITPVNLLDILTDTEKWLNWTRFFKPISGYEAKLENPLARYLAATFCYGCNIGPSQTARALTDFNRKELAQVHQRHIDSDKLQAAIDEVTNAYNRFLLPKQWGSGKHASVDGTKWDIYEQNLLAEYHLRYGGYGGIGYYHISDTYIALFSHFIPCGVLEAIYLLDGLHNNKSDIQPDTIHGDTHSQSATVFGLAYLLGISLMPRIRGWQKLTFYRPHSTARYQHIDSLFTDTVNWQLIETHLPDMLRVAISIKTGKINASTILRKLGTNSPKNKLFQAFHELGCAVRTGFLLQYLSDVDLRAMAHAANNKSEAFNGFAKWLSFGGEGIISTNNRDELRQIIKYNHLVANCLIFYNVVEMSRILHELTQEGIPVEPEAVAALSPFLTQHVNRFGRYSLDLERKPPDIDYELNVLAQVSST